MAEQITLNDQTQMLASERLLDINLRKAENYDKSICSFDKGAVNAGVDTVYRSGTGRTRFQIQSNNGACDLQELGCFVKYTPYPKDDSGADYPRKCMIFPDDITQLIEGEEFKINGKTVGGADKRYDMFGFWNQFILKSPQQKQMAQILTSHKYKEPQFDASELTKDALANVTRTLPERIYQHHQQKWLSGAENHYVLSSPATAIADARNQCHYYFIKFSDIYPQLKSMGGFARMFPLSSVQNISFVWRWLPATQTHVYASFCYGYNNTSGSNANSAKVSADYYEISDVALLRFDIPYTQTGKLVRERALAQTIVQGFADIDHHVFPVTTTAGGSQEFLVPVVVKDLRAICGMLTIKDSLWDSYSMMASSGSLDIFKTDANYPYIHNRHFFPFKYNDLYYKINGQERYPSAETSLRQDADYMRMLTQEFVRELFGDNEIVIDQNKYELMWSKGFFIFPFQRQAFGERIDLSGQTTNMSITLKFAPTANQPSANMNPINCDLHVFKVFDRQLILGNSSVEVK